MKSKRGVSPVIATVLLVAMTVVVAGIVWVSVNQIINKNIKESSACSNLLSNKGINIFNDFTCYDSSGILRISIERGEENLSLDKLTVSVLGESDSIKFDISKELSSVEGVTDKDSSQNIKIPPQGGIRTYYVNLNLLEFSEVPQSIRVSPTISGVSCSYTDTLSDIASCSG